MPSQKGGTAYKNTICSVYLSWIWGDFNMQFNDKVKGSFTLEATFVVTIILWIVFSLCYLSLLSHDQVVLYSSGQKCLRENYPEEQSREVMQKQLFILKINKVVCKENVLKKKMTVTAEIVMTAPFLSKQTEYRDEMEIENWTCSKRMWDAEIIKKE